MQLYVISTSLFYLFVFLKQFYLFPSGSAGVSDIFLSLSFVFALAYRFCYEKKRIVYEKDCLWYVFLAFIMTINGINYCRSGNSDFIRYTLYWIYCSAAIWTFRTLMSEHFLLLTAFACKGNIVLQTLILISGKGRYFYEAWGGSRFMGTFNDPNQFSFFIFTMFLFLFFYYLDHREKRIFWHSFYWLYF